MSCEEVFIQQLRDRGFRFTPQREIVLSVMHQIEECVTADEIASRVHRHSASIDISTIYRTLDLLQDFNMVACIDTGDGQRRYRLLHSHDPQLYLICQSCQAVTLVDLESAHPLAVYLEEHLGFTADLDHLSIPGTCRTCRSKHKSRKDIHKEVTC